MAISGAGRAELLCRRDRGGYPTVAVIRSAFAGGACKRGLCLLAIMRLAFRA